MGTEQIEGLDLGKKENVGLKIERSGELGELPRRGREEERAALERDHPFRERREKPRRGAREERGSV